MKVRLGCWRTAISASIELSTGTEKCTAFRKRIVRRRAGSAAVIQVVGRRPAGWISAAALGAPLAQAVALAFERDDVGVVNEAVDERGGDHGVAEDLAPGLEAAVAGDDDRASFVAAGDQGEEQVRGLALEREVADLVDDQEAVALQAPQLGVERVAVLGCSRRSIHCWAVANATRWPAWQALIASAIARWVLPVPGGPKKQTFMCSGPRRAGRGGRSAASRRRAGR